MVGGRLSFLHANRETVVGDATRLQEAAMRHLETAIGEST